MGEDDGKQAQIEYGGENRLHTKERFEFETAIEDLGKIEVGVADEDEEPDEIQAKQRYCGEPFGDTEKTKDEIG